VDNLVVYRNAQTGRESTIPLECRFRFLLEGQLLGHFVHIRSCGAFANSLPKFQEYLRNNFAGAFHDFDLFGAL
jgi:hypothetical protein